MACYRNGGCGPYEMRSCNECPASKPEYTNRNKSVSYKHIRMPINGIEFTYDDCPTCGNKNPDGGCRYSNICTVNVVEDGVRIGTPSHWIEKIN